MGRYLNQMFKRTSSLGDIHEKTVKILKTDLSKKSYIKYRKEFDDASNFIKIQNYPIHIDIEIDNFCNFACTFCPIGQPTNELNSFYKTKISLDKKKIFQILDECKKIGVKSVQFSLVNEPLTNTSLFAYIKYAENLNFDDIFFVSNGYLLNEKNSLNILNSGLRKVQFSLDAFSQNSYNERRLKSLKPANYNKVIKNILNFLDLKKKLNKKFPLVRVSFIELENNKNEFKDFKNFWKDKVDAINFQKLIDYSESSIIDKSTDTQKCNMPMFRMAIKADGNVKPCCVGFGEKINLGNVYKESLYEIWNSKFMKDFQKLHLKNRAYENPICKTCLKNTNG